MLAFNISQIISISPVNIQIMNLSIIPDAIWKIIYNYAINDISDLITSETSVEDFKHFMSFPVKWGPANVLYNRILITCAKCGNEKLFEYLIDGNLAAIYTPAIWRIASIACEYGWINIVSDIVHYCSFSQDDIKEWLALSLKNLHFEIALWLRGELLSPEDIDVVVDDALYICKSEDKEKILEFACREWNYDSDLPEPESAQIAIK